MSDRKRKREETAAEAAQRLERETMAATSRLSDQQKRSLFYTLAVANPDVSVETGSTKVSIKDVMATLNRDLRRMALANYTAQDELKHGRAMYPTHSVASAAPMFADFDRPVPVQAQSAQPNSLWMHSQAHNAGVVTQRAVNGDTAVPMLYHKGFGPTTTAFSYGSRRVAPEHLSRNPKFLEAPIFRRDRQSVAWRRAEMGPEWSSENGAAYLRDMYPYGNRRLYDRRSTTAQQYAEAMRLSGAQAAEMRELLQNPEMSTFKSLIPTSALRGGTASDDEATLDEGELDKSWEDLSGYENYEAEIDRLQRTELANLPEWKKMSLFFSWDVSPEDTLAAIRREVNRGGGSVRHSLPGSALRRLERERRGYSEEIPPSAHPLRHSRRVDSDSDSLTETERV